MRPKSYCCALPNDGAEAAGDPGDDWQPLGSGGGASKDHSETDFVSASGNFVFRRFAAATCLKCFG